MSEVPQTQTQTPFSWGAFIGGLAIAIVPGAIGNVIFGAMSMGLHQSIYGFLLGCVAGAIFIIVGLLARRAAPAFAAGLICGGCVIGLIGGICGASMVNTSFR